MSVITERFEEKCRECSEKTAVITVQDGKKFCRTFGQLYEDIKSFSGYFEKKGVLSGQKILLFAKISYRLVVFMIAAMRMGIAVMFVDISALQDDPGNVIERFRPDHILVSKKTKLLRFLFRGTRKIKSFIDIDSISFNLEDAVITDAAENSVALLTMTTGSTGVPKIIPRTHSELLSQLELIRANMKDAENDIILTTSFMYVFANLISGYTTVLPTVSLAGKGTQLNKYFSSFKDSGITMIITSPDFCLKVSGMFPELRTMYIGGAILNRYETECILAKFGQADIFYIYGSTECNLMACTRLDYYKERLFSDESCLGEIVNGVSVMIRDDEIFVSSSALLKNDISGFSSNCLTENGNVWYSTGDAGYIKDSKLYYLGRKKFSFKEGDRRIYYNQIEQYVSVRMPEIQKCAFIQNDGMKLLFTEGNNVSFENAARLVKEGFGFDVTVKSLDHIPRDVKHNTKVDYKKLFAENKKIWNTQLTMR